MAENAKGLSFKDWLGRAKRGPSKAMSAAWRAGEDPAAHRENDVPTISKIDRARRVPRQQTGAAAHGAPVKESAATRRAKEKDARRAELRTEIAEEQAFLERKEVLLKQNAEKIADFVQQAAAFAKLNKLGKKAATQVRRKIKALGKKLKRIR